MASLSNEELIKIRNSVNIVDIIKNYISLEKKGKNYFGICPFHDDHTPSMSVSEEKQIFTCFVCGMSGNVFSFIKDYENITFIEAVNKVANLTGISLSQKINVVKKYDKEYKAYDLSVKYYKNTSTSDTATVSQTFTYGATGNKFGYNTDGTAKWTQTGQFGGWDRTGYTLLGWSDVRSATAKKWSTYSGVSDSWIDTHYPSINLYAIWEKITTQTGTEYFVWSGTSDGQATFTFPKEFAAKPKVTYEIKWDNGPHHDVWILSTSTTGWTLYGDHTGERGTYSRFRVNWTATLS